MSTDVTEDSIGEINKYNFRTESKAVFKARKGLDKEIVQQISDLKDEPDWMRDFRLRSLEVFESKPMPQWGGQINLDFRLSQLEGMDRIDVDVFVDLLDANLRYLGFMDGGTDLCCSWFQPT